MVLLVGWSTDVGSIADQLRDAANEALREKDASEMVWCEDYQMYYDHNTQHYYSKVFSITNIIKYFL